MVRGPPRTEGWGCHSQKAGQEGIPTLNHPIQDYLTLSPAAPHTCTGFHPRSRLCAFCRDAYPPRSHRQQL